MGGDSARQTEVCKSFSKARRPVCSHVYSAGIRNPHVLLVHQTEGASPVCDTHHVKDTEWVASRSTLLPRCQVRDDRKFSLSDRARERALRDAPCRLLNSQKSLIVIDFKRTALHLTSMCRRRDTNVSTPCVASHISNTGCFRLLRRFAPH